MLDYLRRRKIKRVRSRKSVQYGLQDSRLERVVDNLMKKDESGWSKGDLLATIFLEA